MATKMKARSTVTKKRLEEMGFYITATYTEPYWVAHASRSSSTLYHQTQAIQVDGYGSKGAAVSGLLRFVNRLAAEPAKEKETKGGDSDD